MARCTWSACAVTRASRLRDARGAFQKKVLESLPRVLAGIGDHVQIDVAMSMPKDPTLASYCMQLDGVGTAAKLGSTIGHYVAKVGPQA